MRTARAVSHTPVRLLDMGHEWPALGIGATDGDELDRLTRARATWLDG